MVGKALSYVVTYCIGFGTGVVYTSNKLGTNPNDIFNGIGSDVKKTAVEAKDKASEKVENIKTKTKGKNKQQAVTEDGQHVEVETVQ